MRGWRIAAGLLVLALLAAGCSGGDDQAKPGMRFKGTVPTTSPTQSSVAQEGAAMPPTSASTKVAGETTIAMPSTSVAGTDSTVPGSTSGAQSSTGQVYEQVVLAACRSTQYQPAFDPAWAGQGRTPEQFQAEVNACRAGVANFIYGAAVNEACADVQRTPTPWNPDWSLAGKTPQIYEADVAACRN